MSWDDPALAEICKHLQNGIITIFSGANVKTGDVNSKITHDGILRALEVMNGLPKSGEQQPNAEGGGIVNDDFIITEIFETVR